MRYLKSRIILMLLTALVMLQTKAQLPQSVIFTVAGHDVTTEEFERQFLKSLPRNSEPIKAADLDEYLNMYINFKLKFQDAHDAGMDTLDSYKSELAGYRRDLARNYLFDKEVTESLIEEAYERWKYEVHVEHILITVDQGASPADTLAAWKKIKGIYDKVSKDAGQFEAQAKEFSDDPGTKQNGGDLGYLTVFQVVYPFETQSYNTPVGTVSKIFRTQFGYHLIKVLDKRANRGEIKTRLIWLRHPQGMPAGTTDEANKQKITEIYQKIKSGTSTFEGMAKSYSEDYNSRYNGGELDYTSATQKVADLDFQQWIEKAFELKNNGDITEPFETASGWRILQRLDLKPLASLQQLRLVVKNQVQNDQRAQKSVDALIEKVKSENSFKEYPAALDAFISVLDSNFVKGNFKPADLPKMAMVKGKKPAVHGNVFAEQDPTVTPLADLHLFTLGGEMHDVKEFENYISAAIAKTSLSKDEYARQLYKDYVGNRCVDYQDIHLEEKNSEFKYLYQEYREGILMFNRMQEKVWDKANNDSAGISVFYKDNNKDYMWKDRFDAQFYLCANKKIMDAVAKELKKGLNPDSIRKHQNVGSPLNVDMRIGRYEQSDSYIFPDKSQLETLFSDPKYRKPNKIVKLNQLGDKWVVVKVNQFLPSAPKLLEETRGPVAAKYQDYLEKKWVEELHNRYAVVKNDAALQALKAKLVKP